MILRKGNRLRTGDTERFDFGGTRLANCPYLNYPDRMKGVPTIGVTAQVGCRGSCNDEFNLRHAALRLQISHRLADVRKIGRCEENHRERGQGHCTRIVILLLTLIAPPRTTRANIPRLCTSSCRKPGRTL